MTRNNILEDHYVSEIHKWISSLNIQYYDVELEIVDHIASAVEEEIINENPRKTVDIVVSELKKWPLSKIQKLIKKKKHHLYWGWYKRLWSYFSAYMSWPKITVLISLTAIIFSLINLMKTPSSIIDIGMSMATFFYFSWIFYGVYLAYKKTNHFPLLLTTEAYNNTIGCLPLLIYIIMNIIIEPSSAELSLGNSIFTSFLISVTIIFSHAFFIVFPRQLRRDTIAYYQHLQRATNC